VSRRDENNFALQRFELWSGPIIMPELLFIRMSPVDAAVQLSRLVDEGGSDPTNFLGG
jgi:hypothetical protein